VVLLSVDYDKKGYTLTFQRGEGTFTIFNNGSVGSETDENYTGYVTDRQHTLASGYSGLYTGELVNGMAEDPNGKFIYDDGGDVYIGGFKNNHKNGYGVYSFTTGETYEGDHKDGAWDGQGTFTWADGSKYVGEFQGGHMHGQGALYHADGTVEAQGTWEYGEFVD
jgi:hypothetical protein